MPICRECKSRISKFDKDVCPVCGCKNPLEGVSSDTIEITSQLDTSSIEFKEYKPCKRLVTFFLFLLIGWTGTPYFYMHYFKRGFIHLICNLIVAGLLICGFIFFIKLELWLNILIPILFIYILNTSFGLFFLLKNDLKDGRGEFLI